MNRIEPVPIGIVEYKRMKEEEVVRTYNKDKEWYNGNRQYLWKRWGEIKASSRERIEQ